MSKYAIKKQGKVVKAYQLGVGNSMETQLIQEGAIKVIGNGQYELFSQEAVNGHGEVAVAGDYFKVDDKNGMHFPYPNKKNWFESNHVHISGDEYQQKPKPNMIWESTDKINKAVKWLLDNKKLVINKGDEQHFFNAVLWGSPLSAAKDAVLVFYGIIKTPNGDIDDIDFNFVARDMFTRDYDYCDKQGNVLHGQKEQEDPEQLKSAKALVDDMQRDTKYEYDKSDAYYLPIPQKIFVDGCYNNGPGSIEDILVLGAGLPAELSLFVDGVLSIKNGAYILYEKNLLTGGVNPIKEDANPGDTIMITKTRDFIRARIISEGYGVITKQYKNCDIGKSMKSVFYLPLVDGEYYEGLSIVGLNNEMLTPYKLHKYSQGESKYINGLIDAGIITEDDNYINFSDFHTHIPKDRCRVLVEEVQSYSRKVEMYRFNNFKRYIPVESDEDLKKLAIRIDKKGVDSADVQKWLYNGFRKVWEYSYFKAKLQPTSIKFDPKTGVLNQRGAMTYAELVDSASIENAPSEELLRKLGVLDKKSSSSKLNLEGPEGSSAKGGTSKSPKYKIVGRYMEGARVSAYCLEDETGKVEPYTRDQTIYLVSRGDVSNCKAQLGEKAVVLSGYPTPLRDLPVLDLKTMQTRNNDGMAKPTKSNPNKLGQWNIVALVVADNDKRMVGGYVIQSPNGDKRTVSADNCRKLIKDRQIGNARLNMYNGKALIRAKEGNFNDLPKIPVSQIKKNSRGAVK